MQTSDRSSTRALENRLRAEASRLANSLPAEPPPWSQLARRRWRWGAWRTARRAGLVATVLAAFVVVQPRMSGQQPQADGSRRASAAPAIVLVRDGVGVRVAVPILMQTISREGDTSYSQGFIVNEHYLPITEERESNESKSGETDAI
jgi:hypothetical protein